MYSYICVQNRCSAHLIYASGMYNRIVPAENNTIQTCSQYLSIPAWWVKLGLNQVKLSDSGCFWWLVKEPFWACWNQRHLARMCEIVGKPQISEFRSENQEVIWGLDACRFGDLQNVGMFKAPASGGPYLVVLVALDPRLTWGFKLIRMIDLCLECAPLAIKHSNWTSPIYTVDDLEG